jgi:DNA-binding NarL/FixJ family response regulator
MKIFIADHSQIDRSRVITQLAGRPDVSIVGTAETAHEARDRISRLRPDVVLLDERLCATCSIDLLQLLTMSHPDLQVIVLRDHSVSPGRSEQQLRIAGADFVLDKAGHLDRILEILNEASTRR